MNNLPVSRHQYLEIQEKIEDIKKIILDLQLSFDKKIYAEEGQKLKSICRSPSSLAYIFEM